MLLHIVADSYSDEHATREVGTWRLVTIKGWQLSRLNWPKAANEKPGTPDAGTRLMLHRKCEALGDDDWRGNHHGLSARAEAAAEACADLMVLLYWAQTQPHRLNALWQGFAVDHFQPINSTLGPCPTKRQWKPK